MPTPALFAGTIVLKIGNHAKYPPQSGHLCFIRATHRLWTTCLEFLIHFAFRSPGSNSCVHTLHLRVAASILIFPRRERLDPAEDVVASVCVFSGFRRVIRMTDWPFPAAGVFVDLL